MAVLTTLLQLNNMNYRANTVLYCSIIRIGLQFSIISKFLWYHLEKGKCGSRKLPRTGIGLFLGLLAKQNDGLNMVTVNKN